MDKFIQGAIKKPGQLHSDLGVPQGQPIPKDKLQAATHEPGKIGQRARFAQLLAGFKHVSGAAGASKAKPFQRPGQAQASPQMPAQPQQPQAAQFPYPNKR